MRVLITTSLLLNIAVLLPVCAGLLRDAGWTGRAYGGMSPARGILLSVYLSIAIVSCALLTRPEPRAAASLLTMQMVYKLTTPFTVRSWTNPVVISNLLIAAVHLITIVTIYGNATRV